MTPRAITVTLFVLLTARCGRDAQPVAPSPPPPHSSVAISIVPNPVPSRVVSSGGGVIRYELQATVTFSSADSAGPLPVIVEVTGLVRRFPSGAVSGGSTTLNRSLASGPARQTYTQQFQMRPEDVSAVWVFSAKGNVFGHDSFSLGSVELPIALAPAGGSPGG